MSPLRWTTKSLRSLAGELTRQGHATSAPTVGRLLRENGFSLQANAKTLEGAQHPDRDTQFRYINDQVKDHQAGGEPVVSVDTKKKEVVGEFKNAGREWRPAGDPVRVDVHDFPGDALGKALPYGIYDLAANTGWVSVGTDHDTAAFAVESIRRWWSGQGRFDYPRATRLLITADAGGSNGYRTRAWKTELASFAAETGLAVTVCHMPPGTSKWNRIEHRLFSAITMNWRGRPLTSYEVIVQTITATTTHTGLSVHAELDPGSYPTGVKVSDVELNAVPLTGHAFHGEWNYTVHPRTAESAHSDSPAAGLDRGALSHPALTGMTSTALTALAEALATEWQALHAPDRTTRRDGGERRRAPGGGRRAKLDLADRVLATVLQQHLALPPTVLARLFTVSKDTIREATGEIRHLMDQHGHTRRRGHPSPRHHDRGRRQRHHAALHLVDGIPSVAGRPGRPRRRPESVLGDKAYDSKAVCRELRRRRILPVISRKGSPNIKGLGKLHYVVEQTFALVHQFKRLAVRWERRLELHDAFAAAAGQHRVHRPRAPHPRGTTSSMDASPGPDSN
jgi:hypothetical protein